MAWVANTDEMGRGSNALLTQQLRGPSTIA
jgi:hypothetical protein